MKKIVIYLFSIIIAAVCLPNMVFAGSVAVSPGSLSLYVGESKSFNIIASNAAIIILNK